MSERNRVLRLPCLLFVLFALYGPMNSFAAPQESSPGPLLTRPDYFPIAVWLQDPKNASDYRKIGINLYVGLWKGPTSEQLARLKAAGMPAFSNMNDVGLTDANKDVIVGWMMKDEPDNAQRQVGQSGLAPPIPPMEMVRRYRNIRQRDPSRPVLLNLGQGVAWDEWYGRGPRTNHPEDYEEYVTAADIVSFDIYPVTHRDPAIRGRLDLVAKGTDRLVTWTKGAKPIWTVIGASRGSNPDALPTGEEVRNMVWLSIIHGARGILYFVHQFEPTFVEAALLQHPDLRQAVARTNARITSLARVLNSATLKDVVTVTPAPFDGGNRLGSAISMMVKSDTCAVYIFAGSKSRLPGAAHFKLAQSMENQMIDVLDEDRTIQLDAGGFKDSFGPYDTHIYRIARNKGACN